MTKNQDLSLKVQLRRLESTQSPGKKKLTCPIGKLTIIFAFKAFLNYFPRHRFFRLMATGSVVLFMICIVLGESLIDMLIELINENCRQGKSFHPSF